MPNPPDQVTVPPLHPTAVKIAFSTPQIIVLFADIDGAVGVAPVDIVTLFEFPEVPQLVVHVAVYVPAPTSFVRPVPNPPDQVSVPPLQPAAVNVAFSVPQSVVLFVDIVGAVGVAPVVIVTLFEFPEVPQPVVHVAV